MIFKVEIMSADIIQILWEGKTINWLVIIFKMRMDTDTEKWKRTLTEKWKQYWPSILDRKKKTLVSRINRKMSDIDVLLYTHKNNVPVKEELLQLNDV